MALTYNTNIARDGLILNIDAANIKSNKRNRTLINWNTWTVGTGGVTGYPQNGDTTENARVLDTNPWGNSDIVWETRPSGNGEADGGWEGTYFSIDNTKLYRFSVWMRRTSSTSSGSSYFGLHTNGTGDVFRLSDGTSETNPYWDYSGIGRLDLNTWYLVVGHLYPFDTTRTAAHPDSGIYTIVGGKVFSNQGNVPGDVKFPSNATQAYQRVYHYYSTNSAARMQFYQPRVDVVDGTEPTIAELLADTGNRLYDTTRTGAHGQIAGNPIYDSQFGGSISFDATNDAILIPENSLFNTQSPTIEVWCKPNTLNQNGFLFEKGNVNTQYSLFFEGTTIKIRNNIGGSFGDLSVTSATYMNTTQWHQVVGSITNGNRRLYINGQLVNSDARSGLMDVNTNGCSIGVFGGFNGSRAYWFNGSIAIVRVYNRQLSDAEVFQNYQATKSRFGK